MRFSFLISNIDRFYTFNIDYIIRLANKWSYSLLMKTLRASIGIFLGCVPRRCTRVQITCIRIQQDSRTGQCVAAAVYLRSVTRVSSKSNQSWLRSVLKSSVFTSTPDHLLEKTFSPRRSEKKDNAHRQKSCIQNHVGKYIINSKKS